MHYEKHLFFCENQKENGKKCCQDGNAKAFTQHAKTALKALDLLGPGKMRVTGSGCLGRCQLGPALVIYPEGVWYHIESTADVDRIINEHVINGNVVSTLLMDQDATEG